MNVRPWEYDIMLGTNVVSKVGAGVKMEEAQRKIAGVIEHSSTSALELKSALYMAGSIPRWLYVIERFDISPPYECNSDG
jgi:hypothetical protein